MGRAGRPSNNQIPEALRELQEEGLPPGWQEYWQGEKSEVTEQGENISVPAAHGRMLALAKHGDAAIDRVLRELDKAGLDSPRSERIIEFLKGRQHHLQRVAEEDSSKEKNEGYGILLAQITTSAEGFELTAKMLDRVGLVSPAAEIRIERAREHLLETAERMREVEQEARRAAESE